jgi:uncharacterized repeat protein (TIGR01451 family)
VLAWCLTADGRTNRRDGAARAWWRCWLVMLVRGLIALVALIALIGMTGMAATAGAQTLNQYTNVTTGAITDNNCGSAAQITRTFTVPASYIVGDVDLGVLLTHTYRSDLRITLQSPAGTIVTVMTWTGNVQSGDNLNDRFDDEAAAAISTHGAAAIDGQTPLPPPYLHSFQPSAPLSAFDGQNAAGTWTMILCDAVAQDTGTFARADLFISATSLTTSKTSSIVRDNVTPINANAKAIPGAVIQYCILTTNAGAPGTAAQTNVTIADMVPATLTIMPGTLFSGTSCATATTAEDDNTSGTDESDPFGAGFGGSTITAVAATLASGASFAILFSATVN